MKMNLFTFFSTTIIWATFAQAATIEDAQYNSSTETLQIFLVYEGGLKEHRFSLRWDPCQTVDGVRQIAVRLIDSGWDDTGTQEIRQTVSFSLANMTCKPAELSIFSRANAGAVLWID